MSRDIRSFFQPKKVQKPKIKDDDDDDIIPESPNVDVKLKKREARKKRVLSDSDEEIFTNKKKKTNGSIDKTSQNTKNKSPASKKLTEVKAVDIFGSTPIKRSEPLVKKTKKKTETGIHSDDDFDKSLLELDTSEQLKSKIKCETSLEKNHDVQNEDKVDKSSQKLEHNGHSDSDKSELKNKEKEDSKKPEKSVHTRPIKTESKTQSMKASPNKTVTVVSDGSHKKGKKRDFSEFTESEASVIEDHNSSEVKGTKKHNKSLNDSVLTDEERFERKRHSAALYQKYLNRSGPKHLGSKEIPKGAPHCLKDCAFLLTGVLDSFERDEVADAITKYGGTIKNSISKKVTHVLSGDEAGPAKIAKAQDLGIPIINENEFLAMIENSLKTQSNDKTENHTEKTKNDTKSKLLKDKNGSLHYSKDTSSRIDETKIKKESPNHVKESKPKPPHAPVQQNSNKDKSKEQVKSSSVQDKIKSEEKAISMQESKKTQNDIGSRTTDNPQVFDMWVEKYKPQTLKQIIGQHGEASNVKKLCNWLTKWYINRKAKLPKPSPWAKNDDGGYYKAVLLSGPPGVGKTTTVSLVCKELGFDIVEFNASDTRNKTLIKEQIGELLTTTSLSGYAKGHTGKQAVTKKHALVMDEVDGMAGNEDRGGLQELIGLIKATSVPIICMCNDRNSQKMRSLVNYCYDLRFNRPRVDQIKAAMMSICCKEGIKIPGDVLSQLIVAANQDVRQTLNLLSMWAVDANLADTDRLKKDASQTKKDIKLGPWEAIRKVFSAEEHKTMSIHDKSDLFFYDYSLAPLFVQENYLQVAPHCPKHEVLERLSRAADSISAGDLIEARIRRNQAWSLLPMQAMYSSVIPGHAMSGHVTGQIQFPGWLGKNSRANKMHRLCQEIHAHTRLSTSGSKSSIFLDYCTHLRDAIVTPLVKDKSEGITQSLEVLESYHLLREDLDSLTELSIWPRQRNPMILIDSKVKAAMTRTYNKKALALPYAPGSVRKVRADADGGEDHEADPDAADDLDEQDDSDPENDALIKKRKVAEPEKAGSSKTKSSSSKDRLVSKKGKSKK